MTLAINATVVIIAIVYYNVLNYCGYSNCYDACNYCDAHNSCDNCNYSMNAITFMLAWNWNYCDVPIQAPLTYWDAHNYCDCIVVMAIIVPITNIVIKIIAKMTIISVIKPNAILYQPSYKK